MFPSARLILDRLQALPSRESEELVRCVRSELRSHRLYVRLGSGEPRLHPLALTPFCLPPGVDDDLLPIARAFHRFQLRLPGLYSAGFPGLRECCPLEPKARAWLEIAPPGPIMIRLDLGWSGHSPPAVFETNGTALAGYYNHAIAVRILRSVVFPSLAPAQEIRLQDSPDLPGLLHRWLVRSARPSAGGLRVGFVENPPFGPGDTEMPRLADHFRRWGDEACWGRPQELSRGRGGCRLRGQPVDWLFRDVPFRELARPDHPRLAAFREMLRMGRVLPGPGAEFDHKGILECFTSREFDRLFTASSRRLFRRSVPWTRVLKERKTEGPEGRSVDLLPFLRRRPELWVIKPNRDCGGAGVLVGKEASPRQWERALERGAREPNGWVVQQWRETPKRRMALLHSGRLVFADCRSSLGVFYGGQQVGLHCRVSPRSVVNVSRGGALACVFLEPPSGAAPLW